MFAIVVGGGEGREMSNVGQHDRFVWAPRVLLFLVSFGGVDSPLG